MIQRGIALQLPEGFGQRANEDPQKGAAIKID